MLEEQKAFEKISANFVKKMQADHLTGIMVYGPFDESYWDADPRIVICNFENYGYDDEERYPSEKPIYLTFEEFKGWLVDNKTAINSAVFVNGLKESIAGNIITNDYLTKSYQDKQQLENAMKNVTYMNLRPTSGKETNQDIDGTKNLVQKYKADIKNIILSLNPNIFIISSGDSTELINYIFDLEKEKAINHYDSKNNFKQIGNFTAFSIQHFSRSDYAMYIKKIEKIISVMNLSK